MILQLEVRVVAFLAIVVIGQATREDAEYFPVRPGFGSPEDFPLGESYCARRSGEQCCRGRNDGCYVASGNGRCFCDVFCNRTYVDCCPDFHGHCLGNYSSSQMENEKKMHPVKNNCHHYGHLYIPGDKIQENCNNCTCVNALIKKEFNWKCTQKVCIVLQAVLNTVNDAGDRHSWVASNYSMFWGLSLDEGVKHWLGTHRPTTLVTDMSIVKSLRTDSLPEEFDARQEWPGLISSVLNQDGCASSWAFSTAGVASDRLSIHSNSVYKHVLSPQHIISCNTDLGQHGCNSGHVDRAWWFIRKVGIVNITCYPYKSGNTNKRGSCALPRSYWALKKSSCPSDGKQAAVFQASPPYRIATNEREIMKELMENGPVQAVINVKDDFFLYKSGVYQNLWPYDYLSSSYLKQSAYHSVRILGWGVDHTTGKPINYWLCANSWGPNWGENGYFRILRGTDESSIESFVIGVWIKVNERMLVQKRKTSANFKAYKENSN